MNAYCCISPISEITGAVHSTSEMLAAVESASREIEGITHRVFWTGPSTRHFDVPCRAGGVVDIGDLISASAASLDDGDGAYPVALTVEDYEFLPEWKYPKHFLRIFPWADTALTAGKRRLRIVGTFGYGNGTADPWRLITGSLTVADATASTVAITGGTHCAAGQTIRVGNEQMYVLNAATPASTSVMRGVNGTTATAHSAAPIYVAQYPADVVNACKHLAIETLKSNAMAGVQNIKIGQYSETRAVLDERTRTRLVAQYRRASMT